MSEKKVEKKRIDYRECVYTMVRNCDFKDYKEKPCEICISSKEENHLYQIRLALKEIITLLKNK